MNAPPLPQQSINHFFFLHRSQLLCHLRHGLEEVGDEAVVGNLEEGCLRILVDHDDGLAVLHSGNVLRGARDAGANVELLWY